MPKAGSQYRMEIVTMDSGTSVSAWTEDDIFTILEANVPWANRPATFRYGWGKTFATYHVTFEPNGDTGYENGLFSVDVFPTGKKCRIILQADTATVGSYTVITSSYRENTGWEKVTLADSVYNAVRINEYYGKVTTMGTTVYTSTIRRMSWWFVPSLGFCGKVTKDEVTLSGSSRTHYTRSQTLAEIL